MDRCGEISDDAYIHHMGLVGPGKGAVDVGESTLSVVMLGTFKVQVNAQPVRDDAWRLSKSRSLVKLLALASGHRLLREQILDLLWADLSPGDAANNFHQTLHAARRALRVETGQGELRLQHGLLSLHPGSELQIDVDVFEAAAARARRSDDPMLYHAAIAAYGGDLLPDDRYEDWAAGRREALRQNHFALLLEVGRRHEARGELKAAMEVLQRAVSAEPAHEEASMALVHLYAASGQRGRAAREYARLADTLRAELDMGPEESSQHMYDAIMARRSEDADDAVKIGEHRHPSHNLPIPLTSFIGREHDLSTLKTAMADTRMLTLMGAPGAGKTRLALQMGWDLLDTYPDGVWLVPMASVVNPESLPGAVGSVLLLPEPSAGSWTDALIDYFQTRSALLIFDNCEHLVGACSQLITALLVRCPALRVLSTSRARLTVPGQVTVTVCPLEVPGTSVIDLQLLRDIESVQLFLDRARFRQPTFELTPGNAPDLIRICRHVEGVPLAIELAAGRVGSLSVTQIADYMNNAPALLTTGAGEDVRHQTLRSALGWSYDLLDPDEQRIFRWLGVFEGGWHIEEAAMLLVGTPDPLAVLDPLTRLVDTSLVVVEAESEHVVRYRFLQPILQYARECLAKAGEDSEAWSRHTHIFLALAEKAEGEIHGTHAREWLDRLESEQDNIRATLRRLVAFGQIETGLRIAAVLWRFWVTRGQIGEGRTILTELLTLGGSDESIPAQVRGAAFNAAGALAYYQTDEPAARQNYEAALVLRRRVDDEPGVANSLNNLALVLKDLGEFQEAEHLLEEARVIQTRIGNTLALARTIGNLGIIAQERGEALRARPLLEESLMLMRQVEGPYSGLASLNNLAALELELGEYTRARPLLEESVGLARQLDSRRSLFAALANLGHLERRQSHPNEAWRCYGEALSLALEHEEIVVVAAVLEGMAALLIRTGEMSSGVWLFGAADALRVRVKTPQTPVDSAHYSTILDGARDELGIVFAAAFEAGQNARFDDAVTFAHDRGAR